MATLKDGSAKDVAAEITNRLRRDAHANLAAVVLVGGRGSHLSPLTQGQPKALVPIGPKPLLAWIIEGLDPDIFTKVYVVGDRYEEMLSQHLSAFFPRDFGKGQRIEFISLVGAPPRALTQLQDRDILPHDRPFLLHYGDILLARRTPWKEIYESYRRRDSACANFGGVLLSSKEYQYPVGVIKTRSTSLTIISDFQEKPTLITGDNTWVNCAVALLSPRFIKAVHPDDKTLFGETFNRAVETMEFRITEEGVTWLHVQQVSDWTDIQTAYHHSGRPPLDDHVQSIRAKLILMGILNEQRSPR